MITVYIGKPEKKINTETVDIVSLGLGSIIELLQSPDLFGEKKVYHIEGLDSSEELRKEFFGNVKLLQNAPNDTVVILEKLLVGDRRNIEKYVTIIESKIKTEPKELFNAFALGNALATGDKKKTWVVFQELITHDDEMEKIHGLVWWKIKDMMQKKNSVFNSDQLKTMARELVSVYHESRLGGINMKERLELFFLTLPEPKK
jgi:hypothetical protein